MILILFSNHLYVLIYNIYIYIYATTTLQAVRRIGLVPRMALPGDRREEEKKVDTEEQKEQLKRVDS